ncbi:35930_t:CDS:2 [Gigaspora margarita]|uniref:35930_t:CDS:1 n=1 Tax=Gigaspora margarita TaxID=4874 RepID=A0ABN7UPM0_GIGMA|nr:35930_t:CDS:2 [Gigaspora margarita]
MQNEASPILTRIFYVLKKICGQKIDSRITVKSDSNKVSYSCGLSICKKALDLVITKGLGQEVDSFKITNHFKYKGRGRLATKRYLSVIENDENKYSFK